MTGQHEHTSPIKCLCARSLTSHGAESEALVHVVVVSGAAPPHVIAPPVHGAVRVVAAAVEEGEVTQGAVGVSASCCNDGWNREREQLPIITKRTQQSYVSSVSKNGLFMMLALNKQPEELHI